MNKKKRISLKSKLLMFVIIVLFFSFIFYNFIDYESSKFFNNTLNFEIEKMLDDVKKSNKEILQIASNLYINNVMRKSTSTFNEYVKMTQAEFKSDTLFFQNKIKSFTEKAVDSKYNAKKKNAIHEFLEFLHKTNSAVDFSFYIDQKGEIFYSTALGVNLKYNDQYIKNKLKKLRNFDTGYFYLGDDRDGLNHRYLILDASLNSSDNNRKATARNILGLAFNMDKVVNMFFKYSNKNNGYGFLLNKDGVIVWDDGYSDEVKKSILLDGILDVENEKFRENKGLLKKIKKIQLKDKLSSYEFEYDGIYYFLFSSYIKNLDVYYIRIIDTTDFLGKEASNFRNKFLRRIDKIQKRYKNVRFRLSILSLCFSLVLLCACLYIAIKYIDKVLKPISLLIQVTRRIGSGRFSHKLSIQAAGEVQDLVDNFNLMTDNLKLYRKKFQKSVQEKERILIDLKVAGEIQKSLLPPTAPNFPVSSKIELFAEIIPAKYVSGDFYEYYFISDTKLFFAIGDISGKGVPASLFMIAIKTLLMKTNLKSNNDITDIIENVNKLLCENNYSCMFATVCCGILDTENKKLALCNCGHTTPLIFSDGYYNILETEINPMLGAFENIIYKPNYYDLKSGNILFFYSDGVVDIRNYQEKEISEEDLLSYFNHKKFIDTKMLINNVSSKVIELSGNNQYDDITMLAIKVL